MGECGHSEYAHSVSGGMAHGQPHDASHALADLVQSALRHQRCFMELGDFKYDLAGLIWSGDDGVKTADQFRWHSVVPALSRYRRQLGLHGVIVLLSHAAADGAQ